MGDINVTNIPPVTLQPVTVQEIDRIAPVTIAAIQQIDKIAPVAVHIKELNQVAPLQVDSLRIDQVRHIDPLSVERLDVTRLPVVNLSVNQVPTVDVSLRRLPPVSIGVHQSFEMPSSYTARVQLLGFEFLSLQLQGCTRIVPRDSVPRERSRVHERSFPDVAAVGNPAIPVQRQERSAVVVGCDRPAARRAPAVQAGPPRFAYAAAPLPRSGVRSGD